MTNKLAGKRAIVTGAASGMGYATALRFASEGAAVLAADRHQEGLDRLVAEADGLEIRPFIVDLTQAEEIAAMVADAAQAFDGLDILVNNAGIMDLYQGVDTLSLNVWRKVMAVNLEAPMLAMRAAVPLMIAQERGAIINVGSIASLSGAAAGAAYTASKHGLLGLTKNVAWRYAKKGLRCNAILPGSTRTNISADPDPSDLDLESRDRMREYQALYPSTLEPADIAALALFLASDESAMINGALISADGGWAAA
jgi:NAD(P)-dependent dehydrogenase (short-subunit alcohol dehydrogenase family)